MRILVATDGSAEAAAARAFVAAMPLPEGAAVRLVSVVSHDRAAPGLAGGLRLGAWAVWQQLCEAERASAAELLARAAAGLWGPGVVVSTEIRAGQPAFEILAAAEAFDAHLIVLGSKGRTGLARFLLGSVAEHVARHSARPVLVARPLRHDLKSVVVALDGSEHAAHAAQFLGRFPLALDAEVTAVTVAQPYPPPAGPETPETLEYAAREVERIRWDAAAELIEAARPALEVAGREVRVVVRMGDPAGEILDLASELESDLIVCGARGVSLIQGLLVGSVADRLLRCAACSVLVVR